MSSNYEVDQQWVEDNFDTIFRIYTRMNQSQASSNRSADLKKLKENADTVRYRAYYELARQELKRKAQEEIIKEEGGSIDLIADLEHVRRLHDHDKWLLHKRNESWRKLRKKYKDLEKERDNYKQIIEKTKRSLDCVSRAKSRMYCSLWERIDDAIDEKQKMTELANKWESKYQEMKKERDKYKEERDNYKQIVEKTKSMLKPKIIPTFTPKPLVVQATIVEEKKTLKQRFRNSIMYLK